MTVQHKKPVRFSQNKARTPLPSWKQADQVADMHIIYPRWTILYTSPATARMDPRVKEDSSVSSNGENTRSDSSGTSVTSRSVRVVLGQKENTLVWRSRMVVLLVLLVTTVSVSIVTYHFTEREEKENFETRVSLLWTTRASNFYSSSLSNTILFCRLLFSSKILQTKLFQSRRSTRTISLTPFRPSAFKSHRLQ
jgi:hypothetical protein